MPNDEKASAGGAFAAGDVASGQATPEALMLARFRARLTYSNVVATLALFLALGGSSYAALSITSKDVKNRSLKGGDLKKDTVTGKEIRESKLGSVPRAVNADTAATASTAGTANVAGIAQDAQNLAGQGV